MDALDDVKPENYQTYLSGQEKGNFTFHDLGPSLNTNFFWFNLNRARDAKGGKRIGATYVDAVKYAWFSNRDFRKAVSKAVDREAIIKSVYYGHAVKNWATTTPGNRWWHSPDFRGDDYDPEGARQLLASIGLSDRNGDGVINAPDVRRHSQINDFDFTLNNELIGRPRNPRAARAFTDAGRDCLPAFSRRSRPCAHTG